MDNPFRYGDIARGDRFIGRERELTELEMDIRSGQNVVIISPRRFGKTSLIFEVMERVKSQGVLVAYVDLFRTPTKGVLADHLASAIYRGLLAPVEKVREKALGLFQRLPIRPTVILGPDGQPSIEFSTMGSEQTRDADKTLEKLLELLGEIAQDRRRRVALVLDEFQEVVEIAPHLPALLRSVFQQQSEVCHVFLGSRRSLMRKVFTDENEPMYRLAKAMILGPIDPRVFASYIRDRFAQTGIPIQQKAVDRILGISEGHPYVTQQLAHFTWNLAATREARVTQKVVDLALYQVLEAESARYAEMWDRLAPGQRLVLAAIAGGTSFSLLSEGVRRRYRLGPASSVQKAISRLVEADLIETKREAGYHVVDPILGAWVADISLPLFQPLPPGPGN